MFKNWNDQLNLDSKNLYAYSYTTNIMAPPGPSRRTFGRRPLYNARKLKEKVKIITKT